MLSVVPRQLGVFAFQGVELAGADPNYAHAFRQPAATGWLLVMEMMIVIKVAGFMLALAMPGSARRPGHGGRAVRRAPCWRTCMLARGCTRSDPQEHHGALLRDYRGLGHRASRSRRRHGGRSDEPDQRLWRRVNASAREHPGTSYRARQPGLHRHGQGDAERQVGQRDDFRMREAAMSVQPVGIHDRGAAGRRDDPR